MNKFIKLVHTMQGELWITVDNHVPYRICGFAEKYPPLKKSLSKSCILPRNMLYCKKEIQRRTI